MKPKNNNQEGIYNVTLKREKQIKADMEIAFNREQTPKNKNQSYQQTKPKNSLRPKGFDNFSPTELNYLQSRMDKTAGNKNQDKETSIKEALPKKAFPQYPYKNRFSENQDEEILEKIKEDFKSYQDSPEYDKGSISNDVIMFCQKALSLQRKYFRDRIPNVEFQDGYNKAQEETKAKVEKLKKCFGSEWKFIHNKINEIFKETSEEK